MAEEQELFLWGVGAPRFYAALTVFILSVLQWIFFSCLSVFLHFKRERKWIEARQQQQDVIVKIGEIKKSDGLANTKDSTSSLISDNHVPMLLNRSTDTLLKHNDNIKPPSVWSLYFDDEIPLGWDWILPPLTGAVMVLGWFIVEFILEVPNDPFQYHTASIIALQLLLLLFVVWLVFRITEVLVPSEHFLFRRHHKYNQPRQKKHQGNTGRTLIPTLMKYVRFTIIVMFGCIMAQSLGFPITSLLGSLGIIGVAVAFAASALLQNLFGACAVVLEEMFHIGDWVRVGDVEGAVEHIGFRTTTIRQWDKRLSIIPNSMFISTVVHNLQETKPYRIKFVVNVPVTTPVEKIEKFLIKGRSFFNKHPLINPGGRFYLNQMTMQSVELMVYVFMKEPWNPKDDQEHNWEWYSKSLQLNEDIVLKMLRISKKLGVEISVPQQKIHMAEPGGLQVIAEHHSKKLE